MDLTLTPMRLHQTGPEKLSIDWSDGVTKEYAVRDIRLNCHCAHCVDEWTREKILDDSKVPQDIKPKKIEPVGRYALRFIWSDGHDTGLYTFSLLRSLGSDVKSS